MCVLSLFVALAATTALGVEKVSDNRWIDGDNEERGRSFSRNRVGLGLGFRIDDLEYFTYTPTYQGRFFRYLNPSFALVGTLEYNNYSKFSSRISVSSAAFGAGVRYETSARRLAPLVEAGIWIPHYWGTSYGWKLHDWGPGLRLAVGCAVNLGREVALDLSLSQILNHINSDIEARLPGAPCPPGVICDYYDGAPDGAYNASALEALIRIGL